MRELVRPPRHDDHRRPVRLPRQGQWRRLVRHPGRLGLDRLRPGRAAPGDVTGDRRTDLLARRSDGTLWRYPGKGAGTFGAGAQIGSGWQGMTALATPGDVTNDGVPELLARRADGTLHLYRVNSASMTLTCARSDPAGAAWPGSSEWATSTGTAAATRSVSDAADGRLYAYTDHDDRWPVRQGQGRCAAGPGMNWSTSPAT